MVLYSGKIFESLSNQLNLHSPYYLAIVRMSILPRNGAYVHPTPPAQTLTSMFTQSFLLTYSNWKQADIL